MILSKYIPICPPIHKYVHVNARAYAICINVHIFPILSKETT